MKTLKHIQESIKKDIDLLVEKQSALAQLNVKLLNYIRDKEGFQCPLGKSPKDALCPECDLVLSSTWEAYMFKDKMTEKRFSYPPRMKEKLKLPDRKTGCLKWKKKLITAVCGCGATATCKCGYEEDFCYVEKDHKCPFCERQCEVRLHEPMFEVEEVINKLGEKK